MPVMKRTTFTTAVLRSPAGHTEIVSRAGHIDPHDLARALEGAAGHSVIAVRHERVTEDGTQRATVALYNMESR